ncbi:OstA-like protein [Dysgonomonas macrotermitis]|uniref:OstA-like protein n=2 Tax=Dysgonomonas macrotermitis TaxID=1346286 RepID=A0A1M4TRK9_9BACT|nr:OstA-like protein [Dysgonomonas macrotermitis]
MHIAVILCLLVIYSSAQAWVQQKNQQNPNLTVQAPKTPQQPAQKNGKKLIVIKKASILEQREGFEPQILKDSVVLLHDGIVMYCDSAYLDEAANRFDAFGTIEVIQGDTLFLYGSYLQYEGDIQLLKVRNNVRLVNKDVTLFTDSLDYDRIGNIGYYFDGGMLVDSVNELTSYWGQYEPAKNLALFKDSARLTNPKFVMYTDTLLYNTENKIATILGPTRIESDSATIYSTKGWYNTNTEQSLLLDQSRIVNKEGYRTLTGDSILYHKKEGYGEVFGNMHLQDTIKKIILTGHYGLYNELTDYAMATDSALAIEYSQADSLFLHADTLQIFTDSIYKQVKAHQGVRFFRVDVQGVCDSLQFNSRDSTLYMYKNPILWNENHQILGDTIQVFFNDSTVDWSHIWPNAFAIEDKDSVHYNQVKGKDMKAYFDNKNIRHILVSGNAESIFYPEEEDKTMIGMNQTESSFLSMDFKERKIEKIKMWPKATGKMTPLADLKPDVGKLNNFMWYDYLRPLDRHDVFRQVQRKAGWDPNKRRSNRSMPAD